MAAVDMYLKIKGIEGESEDHKHKDEIELESWSWGETQSGTHGAGTGGKQERDRQRGPGDDARQDHGAAEEDGAADESPRSGLPADADPQRGDERPDPDGRHEQAEECEQEQESWDAEFGQRLQIDRVGVP